MITQFGAKNFKCLRDVSVELQPFTVVVGANGSGKTSILQAIDLLCRTFGRANTDVAGEYSQNRTHFASGEVELQCGAGLGHFRFRTRLLQQQGTLSAGWTGEGSAFAQPVGHGAVPDWQLWDRRSHHALPASVWLRLDPNKLRDAAQSKDIRTMSNNGGGMHRALASMMLERRDDFFKLEADLARIVPSVKRLQPTAEHEIRFDTVNGKGLAASQVSEGTLLTLGLLTAIHGPTKPGILLLDDLDRALHPKAQRELIALLRGVQKENPEIQIVGSTHSPYMLGSIEPEEVLVVSLREDGATACAPLTRNPKFAQWKEEFHPGEMWSMFGESWVAEPAAVAP